LANYSSTLAQKPEIIVLTKSDLIDINTLNRLQKQIGADVVTSIIDTDSIKQLSDFISQKLD
jgi:ethanolamine utilization protein EutP (predicted NTPase)